MMSNAVAEAPSAEGSPDKGTGADIAAATNPHFESSPPLSWMAATAAMAAMIINQLLLPAIGKTAAPALLRSLDRVGAFVANLAAISGLVALAFGLVAFVQYNGLIRPRQRLTVGLVGLLFMPMITAATLFEREQTTTGIVLLGLGLAHLLSAHVCLCAIYATRRRYPRAIAGLGVGMAICALLAQLLVQMSHIWVNGWQVVAQSTLQTTGEIFYLLLLMGMTLLLWPTGRDRRSRFASVLGSIVLPLVLGALFIAERNLRGDYTLLLYHAQRVTLFIDTWPRAYSIPIGLAVASLVAAPIGGGPVRVQAAAGAMLLLASGYAPLAPGRLLTSALAFVLISRAIMAAAQPSGRPDDAGEPADRA